MLKQLGIDTKQIQERLLLVFGLIIILCISSSVLMYSLFPMLIPIVILGAYLAIVDFRFIYFLLIFFLSLSKEFELPGGFGLDLPNEPIMIAITAIYFLLLLVKQPDRSYYIPLRNPISLALLLHLAWIAICIVSSENPVVSLKFFLAKIWYIIPFYFVSCLLLQTKQNIKRLMHFMFVGVVIACTLVMSKHISLGLSFDTIEKAVQPMFRNHVNYACLLVVSIPYLWILTRWNWQELWKRNALIIINILILAGIYFSYTRAAILSVFIAIASYIVLKLRLTTISFVFAILGGLIGLGYMIQENTYLDYAPNFENTVSHRNFDNLIDATAKGEDISTMERVYRWVAGVHMIAERPIFGYGPNNFYPYYKNQTVSSFETYVSENPEKSGIHCYYLMVPVEQGIPGLIIFLLLCFVILYQGERVYHACKDPFYKSLCGAAYVSIIVILSLLLVNDLLEADKVGSFFFMGAAFICIARRYTLNPQEQ